MDWKIFYQPLIRKFSVKKKIFLRALLLTTEVISHVCTIHYSLIFQCISRTSELDLFEENLMTSGILGTRRIGS